MSSKGASRQKQPDSVLEKLGPGLITGAADDDPSGIATYSQGGAQFGYSLLWTLFFTYPLMVGIQVVSARIGRVSGSGDVCPNRTLKDTTFTPRRRAARYRPAKDERLRRRSPATGRSRPSEDGQ
jgi:Mn2+/Fe2+ NRAMP family transporter